MMRKMERTPDPEDVVRQAEEERSDARAEAAAEKEKTLIAMQAALAARGVGVGPKRVKKYRVKKREDPDAALYAELIDAGRKETAREVLEINAWLASGRVGPPPMRTNRVGTMVTDSSVLPEGVTKEPGMRYTWCPDRDADGKQYDPTLNHMLAIGCKPVPYDSGPNKGQEVVHPRGFGRLLKISIPDAAEYTVSRMDPGAVRPEDFTAASLEMMAEQFTQAHGQEYLRIQRLKEHGSQVTEGMAEEEAYT